MKRIFLSNIIVYRLDAKKLSWIVLHALTLENWTLMGSAFALKGFMRKWRSVKSVALDVCFVQMLRDVPNVISQKITIWYPISVWKPMGLNLLCLKVLQTNSIFRFNCSQISSLEILLPHCIFLDQCKLQQPLQFQILNLQNNFLSTQLQYFSLRFLTILYWIFWCKILFKIAEIVFYHFYFSIQTKRHM